MSFHFGRRSRAHLDTLHPAAQAVLNAAILGPIDFAIVCGYRGPDAQAEAYATGASKKQFPNSVHNTMPSLAVDVAPWPIDWDDTPAFAYLAGVIAFAAHGLGIGTRWGADWDSDGQTTDQSFMDWGHIEFQIPSNWKRR